ncbi:hypothetical protein VPH35_095561 [Triticum aestivum]|uniref:uncharacterized protein isoform X2 n=1 Tax=Triticum aestivum TaxID=4565 RepID=UPI001D0119B8|nr:uncharacterized protein LOC123124205 isoform X2 [Triticum aestivum]
MWRRLVPRVDAGDILGGGIDVVESVVASINEARGRSSHLIFSESIDGGSGKEQLRGVDGSEVFGDSNDMAAQNTAIASMGEEGDAEGVVVNNSKGSWTRRVRIGNASEERDANPSRVPALEASMRACADTKTSTVVNPALGTSFDTVEEAYEFYNLYSWETGFGVRYAKSRLNVHKKCIQEFVCACAGRPLQSNSRQGVDVLR